MDSTKLWSTFELLRDETGSFEEANVIFCLLVLRLIHAEADNEKWGCPRWKVPEGARWINLINSPPERLGGLLNESCSALERANPLLRGRLTFFDFDSERFGPLARRSQLLRRMIRAVSAFPALQTVPIDYAGLSDTCDEIVDRLFAADRKRLSEFVTPSSIVELMAQIVSPALGMTVYDPVCGVGRSLLACARYALRWRHQQKSDVSCAEHSRVALFGQEKNQKIWALCRNNMMLHGFVDVDIEPGDVLRSPKLDSDRRLMRHDRVIAAPPFHLDNWGSEIAASDALQRFDPVPPKNNADYAFVQHCLASLKEEGIAAILAPTGVLFRTGVEQRIRQEIIEDGSLAAIVSLPGKVLPGTSVESVILVLRGTKVQRRHEGILFVDASEQYGTQGKLRFLRQEDIQAIVDALRGKNSLAPSQWADVETIRRNDWNLSLSLYARLHEPVQHADPDEQMKIIKSLEAQRDASAARVDAIIHRLEEALESKR